MFFWRQYLVTLLLREMSSLMILICSTYAAGCLQIVRPPFLTSRWFQLIPTKAPGSVTIKSDTSSCRCSCLFYRSCRLSLSCLIGLPAWDFPVCLSKIESDVFLFFTGSLRTRTA
ncbi:hypothetical protein HR10_07855 [Porphyromonas gulae]|nr:hypothetical protein HR10_07855 [Porphyromonas gulae]